MLEVIGSPGWARTSDFLINSQALYRLSYRGMACIITHLARSHRGLTTKCYRKATTRLSPAPRARQFSSISSGVTANTSGFGRAPITLPSLGQAVNPPLVASRNPVGIVRERSSRLGVPELGRDVRDRGTEL